MAEVSIRIVTNITDRWGSLNVDFQEAYEGQGAKLVEQVNGALDEAVARVRQVIGYQAVDRG